MAYILNYPLLSNGRKRWQLNTSIIFVLLIWIMYWYFGTIKSMVLIWSRSATFTHGFFILPISLWLIWRKREQLLRIVPKPAPAFLLITLLSECLWFIGEIFKSNFVSQFALTAILIATILAIVGLEVGRLLTFPLLFLFFLVPAGDFLIPPLMTATADFTVSALRLTGIPVHREGLQFVIPSGNWSVVEACSGIRYLIASITVGSLFAYLNYTTWQRRASFIGVAILVPLVANWIRAYLIVMLGHLSNNQLAAGVDHIIYGWVFFGVVLSAMFFIGGRWSQAPAKVENDSNNADKAPLNSFGASPSKLLLCLVAFAAAVIISGPPMMMH